jgi:hypothetical protein
MRTAYGLQEEKRFKDIGPNCRVFHISESQHRDLRLFSRIERPSETSTLGMSVWNIRDSDAKESRWDPRYCFAPFDYFSIAFPPVRFKPDDAYPQVEAIDEELRIDASGSEWHCILSCVGLDTATGKGGRTYREVILKPRDGEYVIPPLSEERRLWGEEHHMTGPGGATEYMLREQQSRTQCRWPPLSWRLFLCSITEKRPQSKLLTRCALLRGSSAEHKDTQTESTSL